SWSRPPCSLLAESPTRPREDGTVVSQRGPRGPAVAVSLASPRSSEPTTELTSPRSNTTNGDATRGAANNSFSALTISASPVWGEDTLIRRPVQRRVVAPINPSRSRSGEGPRLDSGDEDQPSDANPPS